MKLKLDDWQKEVLQTKGNLVLRSGRQVGKSTIISIKAAEFAATQKAKTILVISSVERQAYLLFEKILAYLYDNYKSLIKRGSDRPTKHRVKLMNGSVIHCLPTGLTGAGIRGYTVDCLIADEAAFIPDEVWTAVTPMLAVTRGKIILLSTPHGREGYFYRCFDDETFTTFHISSEECPRKDDVFLKHEKERMTKLQYAQEYLGEFIDELRQFFPTNLIKQTCILEPRKIKRPNRSYFLGVDVAGRGADDSTFEILDITNKKDIEQVHHEITNNTKTTETTRKIISLERTYHFKKIYVDDGGMGFGVLSELLDEKETKRKTEGINNARRIYERDSSGKEIKYKRKRLMKEELYNNLLSLMERDEIKLLDDDEIMFSLKSIQYEYTDDGQIKIFSSDSHITEGIIRSAWGSKSKSLNILSAVF